MASTALSVAVLSAGVALMIVAQLLVFLWALRRGGAGTNSADQERDASADESGGKGLSADELETVPCYDFFSSGAAVDDDCAVCLEAFEAGDPCRRLPWCRHSFHAECVDPWLEKSRCCPVCRADVVPRSVKVAGDGRSFGGGGGG